MPDSGPIRSGPRSFELTPVIESRERYPSYDPRIPVTHIARIHELAEQQHGYFTTAQATAAGIRRNALTLMARRGILERVSQGLYRIASYPVSPLGAYMEAVLWPQRGVKAVLLRR